MGLIYSVCPSYRSATARFPSNKKRKATRSGNLLQAGQTPRSKGPQNGVEDENHEAAEGFGDAARSMANVPARPKQNHVFARTVETQRHRGHEGKSRTSSP